MTNSNSSNGGKLIEGIDNYSLIAMGIIFSYIIYILYIIYLEFVKRKEDLNKRIQNIDNIPQGNPENDECPICNDTLTNSCELDCNHKYCAELYYKLPFSI